VANKDKNHSKTLRNAEKLTEFILSWFIDTWGKVYHNIYSNTQSDASVLLCPREYLRSIAMSTSVCVSVRRDICGTTCMIFTKFLCMLPMATARSSSSRVTKSQGEGAVSVYSSPLTMQCTAQHLGTLRNFSSMVLMQQSTLRSVHPLSNERGDI